MKVLVITSCTGEKAVGSDRELTLQDFRQGTEHVKAREGELQDVLKPAGEMYTGQQHVRLMRGVDAMRGAGHTVDLQVLSAGYGMIPEKRKIAPYEVTFQGMKVAEIRSLAGDLWVPEDFRKVVEEKYDLILVLLGGSYLRACALDETVVFGGPTLLFCGTVTARKLPTMEKVKVVTLSNPEATRFSCGLIGLKGEVAHRICMGLLDETLTPSKLMDMSGCDLVGGRAAPGVDWVISLPRSWVEAPRKKLRYFIPEWDDLVDPDYDFLTDTHSGGRGEWANEVYAHQIYKQPNYDGILMSRAVAEKSKKKAARINEMGVHRYFRVPPEFPIMGDCGAFDYIMEDVPAYSSEDVLDYYTRLGFNYGVSVDHLIVKATDHQRMDRYELTIANAEEFLKLHKSAKLPWTPVGSVQGWEPAAYAEAARQYAQMGYDHIALGGLVRSTTPQILAIIEAVRQQIPQTMQVHLFGVARANIVKQMIGAGVTSIDSASHLRRAWLGAGKNYLTIDGADYTAIRIPQVGKSFRAKRMVSEGRVSLQKILSMEADSLRLVRDYDRGRARLDETLDTLCAYDKLIDQDRKDPRVLLEKLLSDKPWKQCPCDICRKDGVEVVIFRGNNRNRRRGFHNTYAFYRQLDAALKEGCDQDE